MKRLRSGNNTMKSLAKSIRREKKWRKSGFKVVMGTSKGVITIYDSAKGWRV